MFDEKTSFVGMDSDLVQFRAQHPNAKIISIKKYGRNVKYMHKFNTDAGNTVVLSWNRHGALVSTAGWSAE